MVDQFVTDHLATPRQARIRPPLKTESQAPKGERVTKDGKKVLIGFGDHDSFDFDFVYGPDATSASIVERDIERWLRTVTQGYHGAVITFGEVGRAYQY